MKCLMVSLQASPETNAVGFIASCRQALDAMGISYTRRFVNSMGSLTTVSANYDFILIPYLDASSYATNIIDQSGVTIPVFCLGMAGASASTLYGATPGVSGNASGVVEVFVDPTWSTSPWWRTRGRHFTPAGGTAVKTVSATSPIDGAAQTGAGNFVEWYTTKAGAGGLYCSVTDLQYMNPLAEMIQTAYNNGDFTATQMGTLRRAPVVFDLDHVNDPTWDSTFVAEYAASTIDNFDRLMGFLPSGAVSWGGITNGSDAYITGMGATMNSRLREQSGNKLRYCYHTHHATRAQPVSGTWPSITQVKTKTEQDTYYGTDKGYWEAQGLEFHTPAYYNSGSQAWNEDTLALFSEDVSLASSPSNNVSRAGYGFRVFRGASTSTRKIPTTTSGGIWRNAHKIKRQMRGILLVPVLTLNTATPMATAANWLDACKNIHAAINQGASLFLHASDFKAPQAPLTNWAGDALMKMLNDLAARLVNVAHFYANPLDYWAGRGAGKNPA